MVVVVVGNRSKILYLIFKHSEEEYILRKVSQRAFSLKGRGSSVLSGFRHKSSVDIHRQILWQLLLFFNRKKLMNFPHSKKLLFWATVQRSKNKMKSEGSEMQKTCQEMLGKKLIKSRRLHHHHFALFLSLFSFMSNAFLTLIFLPFSSLFTHFHHHHFFHLLWMQKKRREEEKKVKEFWANFKWILAKKCYL